MKIDTKLIHAGAEPDPTTGAIMTPIYQTSTYVQSAPGKHKGFEYARSQNPTRQALEEAFAIIENGKYGLGFSSGVAATDAVVKLLQPGDEVICAISMSMDASINQSLFRDLLLDLRHLQFQRSTGSKNQLIHF